MNKTKYYLPTLLLLVPLLFFTCKKDKSQSVIETEDKISIDFEKRVNTWVLDEFYKNGIDHTQNLTLTNLTHKIEEQDFYGFTFWHTNSLGVHQAPINSTYFIEEEKNEIFLNYSYDSISISNEFILAQSMTFGITNLNENNFWMEYEKLGNTFELRFVPE